MPVHTYPLRGVDAVSRWSDFRLTLVWKKENVVQYFDGWVVTFVVLSGGSKPVISLSSESEGSSAITFGLEDGGDVPSTKHDKVFVTILQAQLNALPDGNYSYYCSASKDGATEPLLEEAIFELR